MIGVSSERSSWFTQSGAGGPVVGEMVVGEMVVGGFVDEIALDTGKETGGRNNEKSPQQSISDGESVIFVVSHFDGRSNAVDVVAHLDCGFPDNEGQSNFVHAVAHLSSHLGGR